MRDPAGRLPMVDADLEAALRDLSGSLAIPVPAVGLDPARRARLRIEAGATDKPRRHGLPWPAPTVGRRFGRGLVLALVAVIVVAAIAGAIGLGLPGIRIVPVPSGSPSPGITQFPGRSPSPPPSSLSTPVEGALGTGMGLGDPIAIEAASSAVDFPVLLPTAAGVGPPAGAWLLDGRLSLVWPTGRALPPTREPAVGLILSEFRGSVDPGYFEKIIGPDTTLTTVTVDGVAGYWISGAPHEIVFVNADGLPVFDSRRIVGDTLLWARGDVTYRLESGLDRASAIALAGSLR